MTLKKIFQRKVKHSIELNAIQKILNKAYKTLIYKGKQVILTHMVGGHYSPIFKKQKRSSSEEAYKERFKKQFIIIYFFMILINDFAIMKYYNIISSVTAELLHFSYMGFLSRTIKMQRTAGEG